MDENTIIDQLEELIKSFGVQIRREPITLTISRNNELTVELIFHVGFAGLIFSSWKKE